VAKVKVFFIKYNYNLEREFYVRRGEWLQLKFFFIKYNRNLNLDMNFYENGCTATVKVFIIIYNYSLDRNF